MQKRRRTYKEINRSYHSKMKSLISGEHEKEIFTSLSNGKNSYMRLDRLESSSFDKTWIEVIEDCIFDLGDIIANPRQVTKTEGALVPVELARKTNAESVQHLSSHTQYIKEIDDYGNVIPSKILTMVSDDDIHTYENRFIATFVRRLSLFISKRYEFVSKFAELHDEEILFFKNQSVVDGATVEIETKIKIKKKNDSDIGVMNNTYIQRIAQLHEYILYYMNSPFMRQMRTDRDVRNPILQTNIIRKNLKYHHCYEVYRFIERYDSLGANYKVDENYSIFSEDDLAELNRTIFGTYITLKGREKSKQYKLNSKVYKPKILTSMDDESYIYGPLLSGPISFVRVDEEYQQYLDSKLKKDLPLHPTKQEKEYYADEYEAKKENKQDLKQKKDLLKRKQKEVNQFEKSVQAILKRREEERLKLLQQEKDIIQAEETALLEAARQEIINASLSDHKDTKEAFEKEDAERHLAEIKESIANTNVIEASHPYTEPVTYEEAVAEIWPQTKNVPALRVATKEEAIPEEKEAQPVEQVESQEEAKEAHSEQPVNVTEMSHPYSKPVTYEEAVDEIWPQAKNAPALRVVPKEEVQEQQAAPVQEQQVNEQPEVQEEVSSKEEKAPEQIKVVEMSHPDSEPVTYEEAVLSIWPKLANENKAVSKEETKEPVKQVSKPKKEKAPNKDKEEQKDVPVVTAKTVKVVEMSHPYSEPVSYEEATLEIWPNLKDAPVLRVAPKEEQQEADNKEQPQEVANDKQPVKVVEMSHPHSEPVTYDEAVEEIWPQTKNAPLLRVAPQEETKEAESQEKKKAPIKKAATKKEKPAKAKEQPKVEEEEAAPIKEEKAAPIKRKASKKAASKEEPVVEDLPKEEPAPIEAEEAPVEEAPVEEKPAQKQAQPKKAPVLKVAPKKATPNKKPAPKKEAPKAPVKIEQVREKIPGRFIVKTNKGYYVKEGKYSIYKDDAKIFDDFNLAKDIKKALGGKVVKL